MDMKEFIIYILLLFVPFELARLIGMAGLVLLFIKIQVKRRPIWIDVSFYS